MFNCTITLEGKSMSDIESAIDEAKSRIMAGNHMGFDSNDSGSFHFDVSQHSTRAPVPRDELEVGMYVTVSDPKHADSTHNCEFVGRITELDDTVTVRDGENRNYEVDFNEIIEIHD